MIFITQRLIKHLYQVLYLCFENQVVNLLIVFSDSLEGNDYRLRIASTVTREPDKIAAEVDKQTLSSATNDPEITELHNVNTQANNTQSIHASNSSTEAKRDEGLESARKRVKFSADLNDSVRENLVDLWYEILSMKQQAKACSCKKNDEDVSIEKSEV